MKNLASRSGVTSSMMFSDPPFGKLDLISCRNVMIYFQPVLRRGLFAIFHQALKNNGYLFLGKSETAGEYINLFKPVCSTEKIYIHKSEGKVEFKRVEEIDTQDWAPDMDAILEVCYYHTATGITFPKGEPEGRYTW